MQVKITNPARRRLNKIDEYYKRKGAASVGRKLRLEIVEQSKKLSSHPALGQEEEYLKELDQGHRYLLIPPNYKLIYLVIDPIIYITDIFDVRRNPEQMKS